MCVYKWRLFRLPTLYAVSTNAFFCLKFRVMKNEYRIQVYNPYTKLSYFLFGTHRNESGAESRIKKITKAINADEPIKWNMTNANEPTEEHMTSAELKECLFSIV